MASRQFSDWLDHIAQKGGSSDVLGFNEVKSLASRLGLTQFDCPVIKVAGTNGKGSTVAALEALAKQCHVSVAIYTSPHFFNINERLRINSKLLCEVDWCNAFQYIEERTLGFTLSFFEWVTLAALRLIQTQAISVDLIVLEVGLGGRLDAVNMVESDFSIITSIDLDHQEMLGDTREAIAYEKSGIIAKNGLLVCADPKPPETIFEALRLNNASGFFINHDFHIQIDGGAWAFTSAEAKYHELNTPLFVNNLAAALMMWLKLPNVSLKLDQCQRAFSHISLPGRYEVDPVSGVVFDVAHNAAAIGMLCAKLKSQKAGLGRLIAIFAVLKDKDIGSVVPVIKETFDVIFCPQITHPRAINALKLSQQVQCKSTGASMSEILKEALALKNEHDTMVVFGSFFTVIEAKTYLQDNRR